MKKLEKFFQPKYTITNALTDIRNILINQDLTERPFESIGVLEHIRHICNKHLETYFTFNQILSLITSNKSEFEEMTSQLAKKEMDLLNWNSAIYQIYENIRFLIETIKMRQSNSIPAEDSI